MTQDGRSPEDRTPHDQIGERLKSRRRHLGRTLEQVAGSAGLTKGFLSDVERGRTSPSMSSLINLCRVLEIELSSLFQTNASPVVRKEARRMIPFGGSGAADYQITPGAGGRIAAFWSELEPGAAYGDKEYSLNSEEELVLVIDGTICVSVQGEEYTLQKGDAVTFDPHRLHNIWNASKEEPATAVFVLTPPPR